MGLQVYDESSSVEICGSGEAVDKAMALIAELLESTDKLDAGIPDSSAFEVLEVPKARIGRVIGNKGATISKLQADSGAKLDVIQNPHGGLVEIRGSREAVDNAMDLIAALLDDGQPSNSSSAQAPGDLNVADLGSRPKP